MKNLQLLSILFMALAFTSCDDDEISNDDETNISTGKLTIDGNEYDLKSGMIKYYGSYEDPNIYNFDITLVTTDVSMVNGEYIPEDNVFSAVYFEMWTDNPDNLAIGEYTFSTDMSAGTFSYADLEIDMDFEGDTDGAYYYFESGTVQILQNGPDTYEIIFDCIAMNDMVVSGTYEGTVFTENVDRQSNGKQASKKLLLTKKK